MSTATFYLGPSPINAWCLLLMATRAALGALLALLLVYLHTESVVVVDAATSTCTSPVFTSSANDGGWTINGYHLHNNVWNAGAFPDATTTGVSPTIARTAYTGPQQINVGGTLTAPLVISNKNFTGGVVLGRGVSYVTFQNCYFNVGMTAYWCIDASNGNVGIQILDCTLIGGADAAVAGDYYMRRCDISGSVDGLKASASDIQDCYIHDLALITDSSGQVTSHNDGIQCLGTNSLTIQHNRIVLANGANAAVILSTGAATQMENILINNNLLGGGGWTVYGGYEAGTDDLTKVANISITNNKFTTAIFANSGAFGPMTNTDSPVVVSGNVWYDGPNGPGPQTIYGCSEKSWYVVSTQTNTGDGSVKTYPNIHLDLPNAFTTGVPFNNYASIWSTFAGVGPKVGIYNVAYDLWLNGVGWGNGHSEYMIWTENHGQTPLGTYDSTVTISGYPWKAYHYINGSANVVSLVAPTPVASGLLDLKAFIQWGINKGWIPPNPSLNQFCFGVEIVDTLGAQQQFVFTDFSVKLSTSSIPPPTTTLPSTTTPKPTTTIPSTTTPKPTTTIPSTTTPKPTTTMPSTTTPKPTTTMPSTTTPKPTTTVPATTTPKPTTTVPSTTPPATTQSGYLGCFVDQASPRSLQGLTVATSSTNSTSMTIPLCRNFCGLRGYAFAGLQNGRQCFCGQSITSVTQASESECSSPCAGNTATKCGGVWRNSVYRSTATGYKGCFIDNKNTTASRDLPVKVLSGTRNSIFACVSACQSKNYTYAGLQWSQQCWCGNSYGRYGAAPFAQCNMVCTGDATQMCGSGLRNSVYAVKSVVVTRADAATTTSSTADRSHFHSWWIVLPVVVVGLIAAAVLVLVAVVIISRKRSLAKRQQDINQQLLQQY